MIEASSEAEFVQCVRECVADENASWRKENRSTARLLHYGMRTTTTITVRRRVLQLKQSDKRVELQCESTAAAHELFALMLH
jgi:hypothetical protein